MYTGTATQKSIKHYWNKLKKLEHVIFAGFTHEPAVELSERLCSLLPGRLQKVFFSDNGSTAVEVALKMAYQYWGNRGESNRKKFVVLQNSYHGDTVGAMSVSHDSLFTASYSDLLFHVERVSVPAEYLASLNPEKDGNATAPWKTLKVFSMSKVRKIAAIIIEPMLQAAGGMIVYKPMFLKRLRELCDVHNILLIADEVMTGFGRTGKMFACEHGPIEPDIMCLSKGLTAGYLPMAVTVASETIYEAFFSDEPQENLFSWTFLYKPIHLVALLH